jgi:hypothetical protein
MNNSTQDMSELLVRYLDGELEEDEKTNLEQKLATDNSLREELENLRISREAVKYYGLKEKVATVHQQMMKEMKPQATIRSINSTRRIFRYSIAVAASIVLVFLAFMAYDYFTLSSEKVFANNYQSYELTTFRGNEQLTAVEKAYKEKNYQEVISLQQTPAQNDIGSNFLAGMSNLELNNTENSILNFKKVIDLNKASGTNLWQDQAEFYLALAFLKNKDHDSSIELLQKIKDDPEHLYHEKVTARLLRQVNRLKRK